ncbi:hypothetical protein E2C01_030776 [Portunus trituberculatus]|uniref:Uncharacterized protein n=1 Tax=Portunus trituberculatus TaxID=210409 RepID=A0A5B7EWR0_PORTR|nr:hypothetical protein [Portunus trituberculatus]
MPTTLTYYQPPATYHLVHPLTLCLTEENEMSSVGEPLYPTARVAQTPQTKLLSQRGTRRHCHRISLTSWKESTLNKIFSPPKLIA